VTDCSDVPSMRKIFMSKDFTIDDYLYIVGDLWKIKMNKLMHFFAYIYIYIYIY